VSLGPVTPFLGRLGGGGPVVGRAEEAVDVLGTEVEVICPSIGDRD